MKCKLVKLNDLSGNRVSLYSIYVYDTGEILFERFLNENINSFKNETKDILKRLYTIANDTGARESFFKNNEGKPGDGICALYDVPGSKLRLYCIRYGLDILILGGGGNKPKNIKALQENKKLMDENYLLRALSKLITDKIKERSITYTQTNPLDFTGDFELNNDGED